MRLGRRPDKPCPGCPNRIRRDTIACRACFAALPEALQDRVRRAIAPDIETYLGMQSVRYPTLLERLERRRAVRLARRALRRRRRAGQWPEPIVHGGGDR